MLVCHFILNLRQVKSTGGSLISGVQSAGLRSIAGNVDQMLRIWAEQVDEDEDSEDQAQAGNTHFSATDRISTRENLEIVIGMQHGMGNPDFQSLVPISDIRREQILRLRCSRTLLNVQSNPSSRHSIWEGYEQRLTSLSPLPYLFGEDFKNFDSECGVRIDICDYSLVFMSGIPLLVYDKSCNNGSWPHEHSSIAVFLDDSKIGWQCIRLRIRRTLQALGICL